MPDGVALVTGATGAIGPTVVAACQAAGYAVRILARNPPADVARSGVDVRIGDVCDSQTVRSAVEGADVVVHLAALLHQFALAPSLDQRYEQVNVGGTENVVRAAIAHDVKRLVFLSTIAVYGETRGQMIDERTAPQPATAYGRTKLAAEQLVLSATSGGRRIGAVLRAAAVYGPRIKGNYRRLAVAIARRRYVAVGPGRNRRTIVHERDLARAVVLAAQHPAAAGALFNVSDGCVHSLAEIVAAIHRAVGRPSPRFHVPLRVARIAATMCESGSRVVGFRPPLTRALLDKYTEDVAVDGTRIQRTLGFVPAIDLDSGWRETMAALRDLE